MQRGYIEKHHGAWTLVYRDIQYRDDRPHRTRVRVKLAPCPRSIQQRGAFGY